MRMRFQQLIYQQYISKHNSPRFRRSRVAIAGFLIALFTGCETICYLPIAAFIWTGILLMAPFYIASIPFLPLYYAVEGLPGDTGTKAVAFAPGGDEIVVAYQQRKRMNLYRVPLDGSLSKQLTDGDRFDFDPVYAPDGQSIVFASRTGKTQCNLFNLAFGTGKLTPVTEGDYEDWAPQFSPTGDAIAFTRRDDKTMAHVALVSPGGGTVQNVTSGKDGYDVGPAFLPDGDAILFARLKQAPKWGPDYDSSWDRRSLYSVSRSGDGLTRIAGEHDGNQHWAVRATADQPVITSYAGNLVLCDRDAVGKLRASGVRETPVGKWIEELGQCAVCQFSRDGSRVAFAKCVRFDDEGCESRLHVARTESDQTSTIVTMQCRIDEPVFSPDGTRLVFRVKKRLSAERDHYELWTVRIDGTDLRRLPVSDKERNGMEREAHRADHKSEPAKMSRTAF